MVWTHTLCVCVCVAVACATLGSFGISAWETVIHQDLEGCLWTLVVLILWGDVWRH